MATDHQIRKGTPLNSGVDRFFPAALDEVARVSVAGSKQHGNSGLYDDRSKSNDDADCLRRHLRDSAIGNGMDGEVSHLAKVAWRALRLLQKDCELRGAPLAPAAVLPPSGVVDHALAAAYLRDMTIERAERDDDAPGEYQSVHAIQYGAGGEVIDVTKGPYVPNPVNQRDEE